MGNAGWMRLGGALRDLEEGGMGLGRDVRVGQSGVDEAGRGVENRAKGKGSGAGVGGEISAAVLGASGLHLGLQHLGPPHFPHHHPYAIPFHYVPSTRVTPQLTPHPVAQRLTMASPWYEP